jgi:hypothetical protein
MRRINRPLVPLAILGVIVKLTKCGPRRYAQLVESYCDENGRTEQCTIASFGRVEEIEIHVGFAVKGVARVTFRVRHIFLTNCPVRKQHP